MNVVVTSLLPVLGLNPCIHDLFINQDENFSFLNWFYKILGMDIVNAGVGVLLKIWWVIRECELPVHIVYPSPLVLFYCKPGYSISINGVISTSITRWIWGNLTHDSKFLITWWLSAPRSSFLFFHGIKFSAKNSIDFFPKFQGSTFWFSHWGSQWALSSIFSHNYYLQLLTSCSLPIFWSN